MRVRGRENRGEERAIVNRWRAESKGEETKGKTEKGGLEVGQTLHILQEEMTQTERGRQDLPGRHTGQGYLSDTAAQCYNPH